MDKLRFIFNQIVAYLEHMRHCPIQSMLQHHFDNGIQQLTISVTVSPISGNTGVNVTGLERPNNMSGGITKYIVL